MAPVEKTRRWKTAELDVERDSTTSGWSFVSSTCSRESPGRRRPGNGLSHVVRGVCLHPESTRPPLRAGPCPCRQHNSQDANRCWIHVSVGEHSTTKSAAERHRGSTETCPRTGLGFARRRACCPGFSRTPRPSKRARWAESHSYRCQQAK
jgi:hypothetical protein